MTVLQITCDNCGAKYKLPPTFKGAQAKCQKCGSVIDVAGQRAAAEGGDDKPAAAARPAAARPAAAAKPAVDRSKGRAAGGSRRAAAAPAEAKGKADKPARASARRRGRGDDDGEDSPRRGREKKKDNTPMILGGVGLLAIVIVGAVWFLQSDDKPSTDEQAQNQQQPAGGAGAETPKPADASATKEGGENAGAGAEGGNAEAPKPEGGEAAAPEAGEPAAGSGDTGAGDTGSGDAGSGDTGSGDAGSGDAGAAQPIPVPENGQVEPWMKQRNPAQSMADVQSAEELYGPVQWPDSIEATTKAEVLSIAEDLDPYGGIRHIRAKTKLVEAGYPALWAILERLHAIDYKNPEEAAFGFELNKMIEELTGGLNARYAAVQAGETMHPAKAQWNTKTVNAWMSTFAKWPDEAAFTKAKTERLKEKQG